MSLTRVLAVLIGLSVPMAAADAAPKRHPHHPAKLTTATYRVPPRPLHHHRLRATAHRRPPVVRNVGTRHAHAHRPLLRGS